MAGNSLTEGLVLIESDWNLKRRPVGGHDNAEKVLIESDWNLKFLNVYVVVVHSIVLIESDWNLKYFSATYFTWSFVAY